tara:strand:- start:61 stop:447 length:387 start_codon:yes stop_codon:yes gene_type:complete
MSEVKTNKLTGTSTAGSILVTGEGNSTTTNLQQGLIKAWARLNGEGTIALADSFNNASTTDNATGQYFFNFTNAFSNANYAVTIAAANVQQIQSGTNTTSQCRTLIRDGSGNAEDTNPVYNTNVGDLA